MNAMIWESRLIKDR